MLQKVRLLLFLQKNVMYFDHMAAVIASYILTTKANFFFFVESFLYENIQACKRTHYICKPGK